MVVAGILIKVQAGKVKDVLEKLRKTEEVAYAYAVFGRFDVIATIKNVKDVDTVGKIVTEKIGKLDGVKSTETLIVANI